MKKEDFYVSMPKLQDIPKQFNWELIGNMPGTAGRLDHAYYLFYYASLLPDNSRIVEIGTYAGGSAIAMGCGIKGTNSHIITIDPSMMSSFEKILWAKNFNRLDIGIGVEEFAKHNIHHVLENIRNAKLEGYILPIPDTSENVLKRWDGRQIDMLFVDGGHTREDIKIDRNWMQFVRKGGIAVFDDWLDYVRDIVGEYVRDKPEWELLTESTNQPPGRPWKTVYWRN